MGLNGGVIGGGGSGGSGGGAGSSVPQYRNIVRAQSFCDRYDDGAQAGYTFGVVWAVDDDFDFIRLVYKNKGSTAYDITKAVVAAVGSINEAGNFAPIDAAGTAVPFTPVTHGNGLASVTVPAAPLNADSNSQSVPGLAISDLIALPSRPRADGGRRPYLHIRCTRGAGKCIKAPVLQTTWQDPAVNLGREIRSFLKIGDYTATPAVPTSTNTGWLEPSTIQTFGRKRGATILAIGDSLTQGLGSTGDIMGWAHRAAVKLDSAAVPVSLCMSAYSGSGSDAYFNRAKREIDLLRPDIVTFPVFTPNDGQTTLSDTIIETAWQRAMQIAEYAFRRGAVPVLMGAIPWRYTATNDAFRQKVVQRLKLMKGGTIPVLDFEAVVSDGATPARLRSEFTSTTTGSDPHPNDAGHAAMAAAAVPVIARVLGL